MIDEIIALVLFQRLYDFMWIARFSVSVKINVGYYRFSLFVPETNRSCVLTDLLVSEWRSAFRPFVDCSFATTPCDLE